MDPELQAIIDKAIAAGYSDEDIRSLAVEHKTRKGSTVSPVPRAARQPGLSDPSTIVRTPGIMERIIEPIGGVLHGVGERATEVATEVAQGVPDLLKAVIGDGNLVDARRTAFVKGLPGVIWDGTKETVSDLLSGDPRSTGQGLVDVAMMAPLGPLMARGAVSAAKTGALKAVNRAAESTLSTPARTAATQLVLGSERTTALQRLATIARENLQGPNAGGVLRVPEMGDEILDSVRRLRDEGSLNLTPESPTPR